MRRRAHQRLARHARSRQVPRHHPLGRPRPRCWKGSTPPTRPASRSRSTPSRSRTSTSTRSRPDALGAWPRLRPDADRDHADGRDRRRPHRPVSAAVARARAPERAASRSKTSPTAPAARPAMSSVRETGGRLGFITPMTHNFCESCNRVRLTCTGTLYMCLGQEDAADLRAPLRASERRTAVKRHRRSHRPQAEGPRLRHRPPRGQAGRRAAHECDGRVKMNQ